MGDPAVAADAALSTEESNLYNTVQALLKEMKSRGASGKGRLRWSLQKKLESDPSCSVSLIQVLVKELEKKLKRVSKIYKTRSYTHVIPVLDTLYYVVIQSGAVIPLSLYQTVYECLMKLLILPSPYSTVALRVLKSLRMEMITPGSLYHRTVSAEQSLTNEHFTLQEKVFVLADPVVFSSTMETTARARLEVCGSRRSVERNVVLRVLQSGLGETCQSQRLTQALEALEDDMVEKYFREVVGAVEQSVKNTADGREKYLTKLQHICRDILTGAKEGTDQVDYGSVCSPGLPLPNINFVLWRDEDDLWNLLSNFAEERDRRDSARSQDSGTGRDLKEADFKDTAKPTVTSQTPAFIRRNALKNMKAADRLSIIGEKIEAFPGGSTVLREDRRRHKARVVLMGDDRVLGRLAKAFYSIRQREAKRLFLTKKLNMQLYYVPVTALSSTTGPCQGEDRLSLGSLLGRVDPWYNTNVASLGAHISSLAQPQLIHSGRSQLNGFILDSLCYYLRCGTQPVNLPLYSVKMTRSSPDAVVEDVFVSRLEADVPEFRHLKKEKKMSKESTSGSRKSVEVFGAVITVTYTKSSLSKREVVKGDAPMACGVVIRSEPAAVESGEDHLSVSFNNVNPGYDKTIRTQSISIRALEHRSLSVCLDQDPRRTYTDVHRLEISPCLDPGCNIRSKFSFSFEGEQLLNKYVKNVLSLAVNTFTGTT